MLDSSFAAQDEAWNGFPGDEVTKWKKVTQKKQMEGAARNSLSNADLKSICGLFDCSEADTKALLEVCEKNEKVNPFAWL